MAKRSLNTYPVNIFQAALFLLLAIVLLAISPLCSGALAQEVLAPKMNMMNCERRLQDAQGYYNNRRFAEALNALQTIESGCSGSIAEKAGELRRKIESAQQCGKLADDILRMSLSDHDRVCRQLANFASNGCSDSRINRIKARAGSCLPPEAEQLCRDAQRALDINDTRQARKLAETMGAQYPEQPCAREILAQAAQLEKQAERERDAARDARPQAKTAAAPVKEKPDAAPAAKRQVASSAPQGATQGVSGSGSPAAKPPAGTTKTVATVKDTLTPPIPWPQPSTSATTPFPSSSAGTVAVKPTTQPWTAPPGSNRNIEEARDYFERKDYYSAYKHIKAALAGNPGAADARKLREQIEKNLADEKKSIVQAVELFYDGKYEASRQLLDRLLQSGGAGRAGAFSEFYQGANCLTLFILGGEINQELQREAMAHFKQSLALEADFTPPAQKISERIYRQFTAVKSNSIR